MNEGQEQGILNMHAVRGIVLNMRAGRYTEAWNVLKDDFMTTVHGRDWKVTHPALTPFEKICLTTAAGAGFVIATVGFLFVVTMVTFWESLFTGIFREIGTLLYRLVFFFVWLRH